MLPCNKGLRFLTHTAATIIDPLLQRIQSVMPPIKVSWPKLSTPVPQFRFHPRNQYFCMSRIPKATTSWFSGWGFLIPRWNKKQNKSKAWYKATKRKAITSSSKSFSKSVISKAIKCFACYTCPELFGPVPWLAETYAGFLLVFSTHWSRLHPEQVCNIFPLEEYIIMHSITSLLFLREIYLTKEIIIYELKIPWHVNI